MKPDQAMSDRVALLIARDNEQREPHYEGKETVMQAYDLLLTINDNHLRKMHIELSQPREN